MSPLMCAACALAQMAAVSQLEKNAKWDVKAKKGSDLMGKKFYYEVGEGAFYRIEWTEPNLNSKPVKELQIEAEVLFASAASIQS